MCAAVSLQQSTSDSLENARMNSLDIYRRKATFDVEALRNLLFEEELLQFKYQIWETLAKDPLFATPRKELSLDEKRKLSFERFKRINEYNFLPEEEFLASPLKKLAFYMAISLFDKSVLLLFLLHHDVSL